MRRYNARYHVCVIMMIGFFALAHGYGLPSLNLGYTNILDGGPIRPYPGFYWVNFTSYYHANTFLNADGKPLGGVSSPTLNVWEYITQGVYQGKTKMIFEGTPGVSMVLPVTFYSSLSNNALGITDAGGGVGNLSLGVYTQWEAVMYCDRPLFIHRFEVDGIFPCGTNRLPKRQINPGAKFFSLNLSWSATLYPVEHLALSWNLNYIWNAKNRRIDFKTGDAMYLNFSAAYELVRQWYAGLVGYFLHQLTDNKALGVRIPRSKERVIGLGGGSAYFFSKDLIFFAYLYGECGARNRPQGTSFILRLVKHF